jgi:hypothetical protein
MSPCLSAYLKETTGNGYPPFRTRPMAVQLTRANGCMQASFTMFLNQAPEENLAVIYAFGAVRDDESLRGHRGADVSPKPH